MISVQNLFKYYDDVPILENVSIDFEEGCFTTIVGASGCGKSTFLRILLGQEQSTTGKILIEDEEIKEEPSPDRQIVFQKYSVFPHLTVRNNLILASEFENSPFLARAFGNRKKEIKEKADNLLERTGLSHACNRYPSQLSGGMQQRLAIAQTLMKQPKILLLDEPFGALDPGIRLQMHDLLMEIWQEHKMTVFMVTHDISEAFKLGTRLIVFDKIRNDPQFPNAYGATITYDLDIDQSKNNATDMQTVIQSKVQKEQPNAIQ